MKEEGLALVMQMLGSQPCLSPHCTAARCLLVFPCEGSQLQRSFPHA